MRSLYPDSYTRLMGIVEYAEYQNACPVSTCGLCNPNDYIQRTPFCSAVRAMLEHRIKKPPVMGLCHKIITPWIRNV